MASDLRAGGRDHEGLQVETASNAPEALQPHRTLLYTQSTRDGKHKERYTYGEAGYYGYSAEPQAPELGSPPEKRWCGLRRAPAILLILALLLVILAVVLGATLGTLLKSSSSATSSSSSSSTTGDPISVQKDTGIAVAVSTSSQDQAYAYYQDQNNNVIEVQINGEGWHFSSGSTAEDNIVTGDAKQGTPLAALAGTFGGRELRHLFFVDSSGRLSITNRTTTGAWSTPFVILHDDDAPLAAGTIALDAFIVPDYAGLNAIRVYYGSPESGIREVGAGQYQGYSGYNWDGTSNSGFLTSGDPSTGVGVTSSTDKSLNIYSRDSTSGFVTQYSFGYGELNGYFWKEVASTNSADIDPGSDITACPDPKSGTDYIFYQNKNGNLVMRTSETVPSDSTTFTDFHVVDASPAYRSKLRALCSGVNSDTGPIVYFQEASSMTKISYVRVATNGSVAASGVVRN